MIPTIITLPPPVENAISKILARQGAESWLERAQVLHQRYFQQQEDARQVHVHDFVDAQAYLALRASATYAQISGALAATCEMLPDWKPQTLLDLGCGPGTGLWAASTLLPTLSHATGVDQSSHFLSLGKRIFDETSSAITATWKQQDALAYMRNDPTKYDLIIIANVLNELDGEQRQQLLQLAFDHCKQLLLIVEPGTPVGNRVTQSAATVLSQSGQLIAPYLGRQHPASQAFWLHFPQRFTRPAFARKLRQEMRDSPLMASDWEEAKFCYVAVGKMAAPITAWGRSVGPVEMRNGYLEVPILTADDLSVVKVLKRHKEEYAFAKKLRWGEVIEESFLSSTKA